MTKTREVDNSERPARPEPWEDEATEKPPSKREGVIRENEDGEVEVHRTDRENPDLKRG